MNAHFQAIFLGTLAFLFFTSHVNAQHTDDDISVTYEKKNVSLDQIFLDLEKEYGIRFSYATSSISAESMDVDFQEDTMEDVLEYLLTDHELEYKILDNNILLRKKENYRSQNSDEYRSSMHITGRVTNSGKSEALNYATISISNSAIGTYTDTEGRFDIEIPSGYENEMLVIQYIGFQSSEYKIAELEDSFLIVPLNESQYSIDEITIVNKEKPIKIGNLSDGVTLNNSQISSGTSGVMGTDLARQIQLLPGISAHDDSSADIKIRGSNSDETLMILDGMPIYSANHYYGIFSAVNTTYIDSVNLFKNTYPIHYGGRASGLVELFSDRTTATTTSVTAEIDLLSTSAVAKIPISKTSSLSLAARSTLKSVNNQQFNTVSSSKQENQIIQNFANNSKNQNSDPLFNFYDINAKYQIKTVNNNLRINFFRSADRVANQYDIDIADIIENKVNLKVTETQKWSSTASSILMDNRLSKRLMIGTRAFFSQYINDQQNDLKLDKRYKKNQSPQIDNPIFEELQSKQDNSLTDIGIDSYLKFQHTNHTLKFGVTATRHNIEYSFEEDRDAKFRGAEEFLEIGGYSSYDFLLSNKLKLSGGLRTIYYSNIDQVMFSPRLSAQYSITDFISFKSAYSIEQQVIRQFDYDYRSQPLQMWVAAGDNNIPVLTSANVMLGTTLKHNLFSIDIELYQKNQKGVLEYAIPTPSNPSNVPETPRDYKLFIGDGLTKGIDVILGSGYSNYDTYLSYTLSSSQQQFKAIFNNSLYPSENDRRHQLKWINNLRTGSFTWGLNAIYVSGLPYIDIRNFMVNGDIRQTDPNIIRQTLKAYNRIDISSAYRFKIGGIDSEINFSVFNLLNTKNIKYLQSVATQTIPNQNSINMIVGNETNLLNRTANIGLKMNF